MDRITASTTHKLNIMTCDI